MLGKVDDLVAYGSDPLLAGEKANFGFTISGESASFRNLKVWDATQNPQWDTVKTSIKNVVNPIAQPKAGAKKKKKAA